MISAMIFLIYCLFLSCTEGCIKIPGTRYSPHFTDYKLSETECMNKCKSILRCYKATWTPGTAAHSLFNCFLHGNIITKTEKQNQFTGYICRGYFAVNVTQGKSLILNCSLNTLSWTFKSQVIPQNSKYDVRDRSLRIKNVQIADTGAYTCGDGNIYTVKLLKEKSDERKKKSSDGVIYIVVIAIIGFLIILTVFICLVGYKYYGNHNMNNNTNTIEGKNTKVCNEKVNTESTYTELTTEQNRGKYMELNLGNMRSTKNEYEAHAYEVAPELIEKSPRCMVSPIRVINAGRHYEVPSDPHSREPSTYILPSACRRTYTNQTDTDVQDNTYEVCPLTL